MPNPIFASTTRTHNFVLQVRFTEAQMKVLDDLVARTGTNRSEVIRLALDHYLATAPLPTPQQSAKGSGTSTKVPSGSRAKVKATSTSKPAKRRRSTQ